MPADPKPTPNAPALTKEEALKALHEERDKILADISDDLSEKWRTGWSYNVIVSRNLAVQAGYKSAVDFVNAELKPACKTVSPTALALYARVARSFDEQTTNKYGTTVLDKLLTLSKLLGLEQPPADLATFQVNTLDKQRLPVTKPFGDCIVEDLTEAIKLLKAPAASLDPGAVTAAKSLQAAGSSALGEDSPFEVKLQKKGGQLYFHLRFIPVDKLEQVLKSLLGQSPS